MRFVALPRLRYTAYMDNEVPAATVDFMRLVVDNIINPIIGVIFAAALVYFLWGLMVFILNASEEAKRSEGKRHMLNGIIGMTVMVSVFAIIAVVLATFDIDASDLPDQLGNITQHTIEHTNS